MTAHSASPGTTGHWRTSLRAALVWLEGAPQAIFQLAFRVGVGGVFWHSGLTKIASWQTTVVLFRDEYKVPVLPPELAAALAASVELTCPVLLLIGLATRLATIPMLGMTLVIQTMVYPEDWNEHLIWAAMLLFLLSRGPGPWSVDHWLARRVLPPA